MDAFVQTYLRDGLEMGSIDKLYAKFEKIDTSGLFFPVFITEMTFLGEKIFGKGVNRNKIYNEVDALISFLLTLANRKQENTPIWSIAESIRNSQSELLANSIKSKRKASKSISITFGKFHSLSRLYTS